MGSERTERLAKVNHWEEFFRMRDRQREFRKSAVKVVRRSELPRKRTGRG